MTDFLPTYSVNGTVTDDLKSSLFTALAASVSEDSLDLFYYSASRSGWKLAEPEVETWRRAKQGRTVRAFIGTDHGFTDPRALRRMLKRRIDVYVVTKYKGVYHPKVVVLSGPTGGSAWVGSNNLSAGAFGANMEFALRAEFKQAPPPALAGWIVAVVAASERLTPKLLSSYESERDAFQARTKALTRKFKWSRRKSAGASPASTGPAAPSGALIMEIGNKETGGGRQVQPPMKTVGPFFGLPGGEGASKAVSIRRKGSATAQTVTLTRQKRAMARIVISELRPGDRPGFFVFEKVGPIFEYEIVSKASDPARYAALEVLASTRTRTGSRRWRIVP